MVSIRDNIIDLRNPVISPFNAFHQKPLKKENNHYPAFAVAPNHNLFFRGTTNDA